MLLELQNIQKSYGTPGEAGYQEVLNKLSLSLSDGETISVVGPSGSGKSTLLNILGTLDHPGQGKYLFRDRDITELNGHELDHFRNREIGFVFQFHHLLPQCNVMENVLIPAILDKNKKEAEAYAEDLLNRVGLWEHRHKRPAQLSGGECQRVAVVRAMINKPSLILADEPTGALDSHNVQAIADLLFELNSSEKVALVLVTHSLELAGMTSKKYELTNGQLTSV